MAETELQAAGAFEWNRIIRRCQIPRDVKGVAWILGQHADYQTGRNVRPGTPTIAAVMGLSERTVERHMATLRGLGLIEKLKNGGGLEKHAAVYRLTIPTDLLERVPLLSPDERTPATHGWRELVVDNPVNCMELPPPMGGGSSTVGADELPPSETELPPNPGVTPAIDPPVTSSDAYHHPNTSQDHPIRDLGASSHQRARCEHGNPAGFLGSGRTGILACGDCRRGQNAGRS